MTSFLVLDGSDAVNRSGATPSKETGTLASKSVTTKKIVVPSRWIEPISTIPPSLMRYPGLISAASISEGE